MAKIKANAAGSRCCFIKAREGNSAIEFAFVAPVLFLMLFGIVELGLVMFASSVIENAATSAARVGLTGRDTDGNYGDSGARATHVRNEINRFAPGLIDVSRLQFNPVVHSSYGAAGGSVGEGLGTANQAVTYNVSYDWEFFTPLIGQFFGPDGVYTITSSVIVKNEDF